MPSIPELIWISIKPILKFMLTASGGALLSRSGILTPPGSKLISKVTVNFLIPPLLFGKIIVSFSSQNVGQLGVLVVSSISYILLGMIWGFVLRTFLRVDRSFRGGFVAAATWGNCGDLPMAVIMSLSQSPPFVASDSAKGVAYVSIFAVVAFASLFPLGGYKLIENDFKRKHVEDPEQNVTDTKSLKIPTINIVNEEKHGMHPLSLAEVGVPKISDEKSTQRRGSVASTISIRTISFSNQPNSHVPASDSTTVAVPATSAVDGDYLHSDDFTNKLRRMSAVKPIQWNSALNEPVEDDVPTAAERDGLDLVLVPTGTSMRAVSIKEVETFSGRLRIWLLSIFIPPNIAMILGMTIALVPQLKALFVIVSDGPSILAPDGQPPLAFVYDTMNFIGAAAVPAGIMLLGAALANLQLSAVKPVPCFSLAFIKLVVNPLICILCVRALVFHGIIDPADKMLQFVIMFQSAIPTATTCVYLTQMYSPTGEAKEIAGYLVVQYALGIFTMTASICIILSFLY